jgi:hypothetical protein
MAYPSTRPSSAMAVGSRERHQVPDRVSHRSLLWHLAALTSVAGLAAISLWSAPAPIMAPWDVFILLDGGYRIIEGQVPGVDFSNPIGPLVYELVSLGMRMQQVPSLAAVAYGNVIFLGIASLLAWIVARQRMPALCAAGFTVFVALIVVSVGPLGYLPWITTYAMLYNRYGWVLYATLLLLVFIRPDRQNSRDVAADGLAC